MLIPTVIEKSGNSERAYDIFSRLLRDRIVMVTGEIRSEMCAAVVAQLLFLESQSDDDILMYIDSPGGSITAGMSVIDTMNFITPNVTTIVTGQAASMGSLIATSGKIGSRFMLPHATNLIHQPLGGFNGQASDAQIRVNEIVRWKIALTNIYVRQTGKSYAELEKNMDRDYILTAPEAVEYGLADKVITTRKEK